MAALDSGFERLLLETFAPLGAITVRPMFGGAGVYCDGLIFGLVADDVLYLKVDHETRPLFQTAGLEPFIYDGKGRPMAMSYNRAPENVFEDAGAALEWGGRALEAARRAAARKTLRR